VLGHALHGSDPAGALRHWREAYAIFADVGTPEAAEVAALVGEAGDAQLLGSKVRWR